MEEKRRKEALLERAVQAFDIPGQAVGLPRVELVGRGELRMENHRGILAYGEEEIVISGGGLVYRLRGTGLELKAMTAGELRVTGSITALEIQ